MKKYIFTLLAVMLLLVGCTQTNTVSTPSTPVSQEVQATTRVFVDSAGREVEIPVEITKVAPTGVPSQMALFTACPDKLIGLARDFSEENKKYIDPKYANMAIFGQFYGKNANLNMEALLKAGPDIIIDIGEAKPSIKEDMDALQKQLNIPVVFIEAHMKDYGKTYEMLGDLLGTSEEVKELKEFALSTTETTQKLADTVAPENRKSVYMALGENGLSTNAKGSYHAQILELVGADNAAVIDAGSKGAGSEVSFEQLLLWNPDVIITDKEATYNLIKTDPSWSVLEAVKAGRVYKIPTAPFNVISDPPSVNRIIGMNWLGNLLYPEVYSFDQTAFVEFSKNFYHTELSDADASDILKYSLAS